MVMVRAMFMIFGVLSIGLGCYALCVRPGLLPAAVAWAVGSRVMGHYLIGRRLREWQLPTGRLGQPGILVYEESSDYNLRPVQAARRHR